MQFVFKNSPKIIISFLNYLSASLGYSINTLKAYNTDLIQFFKFIKTYHNLEIDINNFSVFVLLKVKKQDILAFQVYLNYNRNNSPYSRQRKIYSIRAFYEWLLLSFPGNDNPTNSLPNIPKIVRLPKCLTLEEAKKIQKVFTLENSRFALRNNTIISLFLHTGMRVSELLSLNVGNIDFNDSSICVIGKGNRERKVYLNKFCKEQLSKYLKNRFKDVQKVNVNVPLFVGVRNKRLGIDGVEVICKNAYKLIGLEDKNYTTHTLRHTAASIIYNYVQEDILILKEFLRTCKYKFNRNIFTFI